MTAELIGQTLGNRYKFEALVGEGSFANVYRITDQQRRVSLAAKVLRSEIAHDPKFSERFHREAAVLNQLQHPNIVRYYGLVKAASAPGVSNATYTFILMDFVPGQTLNSLLQENFALPKPLGLLTYLTPLAAALHYAHAEGVIHRDLKPANILLHENGTLFVSDFGLARILNQTSTLTVGMTVGTPYYMAPEQVTGETITLAADVYALGVILYRMVAGQLPFRGDTPDIPGTSLTERVTHEQVHVPPPRPTQYNGQLSLAVEEVILRCLAKDPVHRYPSIASTYDAFAEAVGAPPIALEEPSMEDMSSSAPSRPDLNPPEWSQFMPPIDEPAQENSDTDEIEIIEPGTQPPADRNSSSVTVKRPLISRDPTRETIEHPAPPDTEPRLEHRIDVHASRTMPSTPSEAHPNQSAIGHASSIQKQRNWTMIGAFLGAALILASICAALIYLLMSGIFPTQDTPKTQTQVLPETGGGTSTLEDSLTPGGGERFAFDSRRSGNLDLYIMNIDGSGLQQLTGTSGAERGPAWSPDGSKIAFYGAASEQSNYDIYLVNVDGTDLRNLTNSPDIDDRYPTWSPDGTQLAFHSDRDGDYDLYTINQDGSSLQNITNNNADDLGPDWSPEGTRIVFHTDVWGSPYEIAAVDLSSGQIMRLTNNNSTNSFATWSPDATRLAFHAIAPFDGTVNIYIMQADGTELQQVTTGQGRNAFPDWSPDGSQIIFQTGLDSVSTIATIAIAGGKTTSLTGRQANFLPEWEPAR